MLLSNLLEVFSQFDYNLVITSPNADPSGQHIARIFQEYERAHDNRVTYFKSFGAEAFFSLMSQAEAIIGNSSCAIVEAPSFKLPAVNIGTRQKGRVQGANVINVGISLKEIFEGLQKSLSTSFRESLKNCENPYGRGGAADLIVEKLRSITIDQKLLRKSFFDKL